MGAAFSQARLLDRLYSSDAYFRLASETLLKTTDNVFNNIAGWLLASGAAVHDCASNDTSQSRYLQDCRNDEMWREKRDDELMQRVPMPKGNHYQRDIVTLVNSKREGPLDKAQGGTITTMKN